MLKKLEFIVNGMALLQVDEYENINK